MTNKWKKYAISGVFLGFIFLFFLSNLLLPDRSFSQRENRYLQTKPSFSFSKLFSGELTAELEDYCADQFPLRDQWITLNARYGLLSGRKESNGIYLCEDGQLLEAFAAPDKNSLEARISTIEDFAAACPAPVTLGLIPGAAEVYSELLPGGAPNDSQRELIDAVYSAVSVQTLPLAEKLLSHKDEYIFYRTDHHWTTLGAYYGYSVLCDAWSLSPVLLESFQRETLSDSFYGTSYSSSGFSWVAADSMERFVAAPDALQVWNYNSGSAAAGALYHEEKLDGKDKYTYFLGGNTPRLVLQGTDSTLPSLLIVRDSFTDCLAPFLLEHFGEVHLLDLRYYLDSVSEYVEENEIDEVLILYSVPNFCTDKSFLYLS